MKITSISILLSVLTAIILSGCSGSGGNSSDGNSSGSSIDGVAPIVTLIGDTNVTQSFGNYVEKGATAEDNIDGNLTKFIKINPKLNSKSEAGTYIVTYIAIDTAGNEGTAIRSVTINPCENYNPITAGCEDLPL